MQPKNNIFRQPIDIPVYPFNNTKNKEIESFAHKHKLYNRKNATTKR